VTRNTKGCKPKTWTPAYRQASFPKRVGSLVTLLDPHQEIYVKKIEERTLRISGCIMFTILVTDWPVKFPKFSE
jgi:hypothetical protein